MNSRARTHCNAISLLAVLVLSPQLAAQQTRYKIINLGTFGGPNSGQVFPGRNINNRGTVIPVGAELPAPDPFAPNCLGFSDCFLIHGARWQRGVLADLHALPGVNDSLSFWINDADWIVGISENGSVDPLTGFPEVQAVLWTPNSGPIPMGDFGGHGSQANSINTSGHVVGMALNAIPDAFSQVMYFLPAATQTRAFLWRPGGPMLDLGTLGGPDANALVINDHGQVAGSSFTDSIVNATTGIPTEHPFLWKNGTGMIDLHTLGGTLAVPGNLSGAGGIVLNNRGQVAGTSYLSGDQTWHPFLWEQGTMKDLKTLGGENGEAYALSESGYVVGRADVSPGSPMHHAFLWKNGEMTDLQTLPPCLNSTANSVNTVGQVVGDTGRCPGGAEGHPFISERGEPMVDLNTLVLPGSDLTLVSAAFVNDRGEIAGTAVLSNGDQRAVLLVPAGADEIDSARDGSAVAEPSIGQSPAVNLTPIHRSRMLDLLHRIQREP